MSVQFATISQGELKVFDFASGVVDGSAPTVTCLPHQSGLNFKGSQLSSIAWNHTNQVLAVAGNKPQISLVQANNGQLLSTIPFTAEQAFLGGIQALAFSNNSRYLVSANLKFVHLWDLKRRNLKGYFGEHAGVVTALGISTEGDVVAGDDSGCMRLWEVRQDSHKDMVLPPGPGAAATPAMTCLQLSYLGPARIASGYADGTLALWDFGTTTLLRRQAIHSVGAITGLAYSPKNARLVATCGADGRVTLNDTGSKPGATPSASIIVGDHLTCISFHEDAIHCAVGTNAGYALLYDWRNVRKPVAKVDAHLPFSVTAIAFQVPKAASSSSGSGSVGSPAAGASGSFTPARKPTEGGTLAAPGASSSPTRCDAPPSALFNTATTTSTSTSAPPPAPTPPALQAPSAAARPPPGPLGAMSAMSAESSIHSLSTLSVGSSLDMGAIGLANTGSHWQERPERPDKTDSSARSAAADKDKRMPVQAVLSPIPSVASSISSLPSGPAGAADLKTGSALGKPFKSPGDPATGGATAPAAAGSSVPITGTGTLPNAAPLPTPAARSAPSLEAPTPRASLTQPPTTTTATIATAPANLITTTANASSSSSSSSSIRAPAAVTPEADSLRRAMQPVTAQELQEALQLLKYDVHKEIQAVTREQVRQFAIAKVSAVLQCIYLTQPNKVAR